MDHSRPYPAGTQDAECLPRQVGAQKHERFPIFKFPGTHKFIRFNRPAGNCHHKSEGVLGNCIGKNLGSIGNDYSPLFRGGQVNVIVSHGEIGEDFCLWRGIKYISVNLVR